MTHVNPILSQIARDHLNIPTLETRHSDRLDFHDVSVWGVRNALWYAYQAGMNATAANRDERKPIEADASNYSPTPWAYEFSPYTLRAIGNGEAGAIGDQLPAFEVFDADGTKVFDTNEDMPSEIQEANACLATAAPDLLAALKTCATLLADYDEQDGEEGEAYRDAIAAIARATNTRRQP